VLLKDKVVVVEEDVVLMDGEDTVDEEDVILPEVVGELLKDEEVVLLEDVVLGRDVLVRETRVSEVEVVPLDDDEVVLEGDVVLPEAKEAELLVVVLLASEDVPEDDVVPEELENEVGSPKVAEAVLESEILLLSDAEVLDKDGTVLAEVVERLDEVESEELRVAVVLTLDDVEVELPVVDDVLSEDTELIEDAVELPENEVELVEEDVVLLEDELVDPTAEEEEDTPGGLQTSLTIPAASR
jgi:hypothetical protein